MRRGRWTKADFARGLYPTHEPTFRSRPQARSLLPSAPECGERLNPPHNGDPRGHPVRPCTPRPYLVGIRERRRKPWPRTVAATTYSCRRSTSHSNPGKMARRRDSGLGACVNRAEAGAGPRALGPTQIRTTNLWLAGPGSVFALTSQATMPYGSGRSKGHRNPHFPEISTDSVSGCWVVTYSDVKS